MTKHQKLSVMSSDNPFLKNLIGYYPSQTHRKIPISNVILEQVNAVLGKLVQKYNIKDTSLDEDAMSLEILASTAF